MLAGADAHRLTDIEDEDLAVADGAAVGRLLDALDHAGRETIVADDLDLDLRNHVRRVFRAAIDFGLAFLPAETLHLAHRHAGDPETGEASRTSSSLNGLMIAMMSFMLPPCLVCGDHPARTVPIP